MSAADGITPVIFAKRAFVLPTDPWHQHLGLDVLDILDLRQGRNYQQRLRDTSGAFAMASF